MQTFFELAVGIVAVIAIGIQIAVHNRPPAERAPSLNQAELDAKLQHPDEIRQLLIASKKIQAIKLYREETGANLQQAKRAVDHMEAQVRREQEEAHLAAPGTGERNMEEVWRLIMAGQKINAIKAYRQITGTGLKEAKAAVDHMTTGTKGALPQEQPAQRESDLVDPEKLQRLIREGHKIEAIKYFRQQRGVGLKEAKDAVDWLEANMRSQ
jgi:ribosomal protein L7/L12